MRSERPGRILTPWLLLAIGFMLGLGIVYAVSPLLLSSDLHLPSILVPSHPPTAPELGPSDDLREQYPSGMAISWRDTSSDEQGFRIQVQFIKSGETFSFTAPANTTYLRFPDSVPLSPRTWEDCQLRSDFRITIRAYNGAGESPPAGFQRHGDCVPPLTPTPAGMPRR